MLSEKVKKAIDVLLKTFKIETYKLTSVIFAFVGDLKLVLQILLILIFIDLVTGIIASLKKKTELKSRRLLDTLIKIYIYYTVIFTMILVEVAIQTNYFTRLICWFSILTEAKSIVENIAVFNLQIVNFLNEILLKINNRIKNEGNTKNNNTLQ